MEQPVRIGLNIVDASGEISSPNTPDLHDRIDLIDSLARGRGIVFLFDPIREHAYGDTFDHTFGVLAQLAQRMVGSADFSNGRLPHYIAVCVTKFDEARVLKTAERLSLLTTDQSDPYGFPRVDDDDARELFSRLCEVSSSGTADLILHTLEQYFRPEHIKYFVSSAVGFYVDPVTGVYNSDDFQNHIPALDHPGSPRIRGSIHPINVVEPVLWLSEQLAADSRK